MYKTNHATWNEKVCKFGANNNGHTTHTHTQVAFLTFSSYLVNTLECWRECLINLLLHFSLGQKSRSNILSSSLRGAAAVAAEKDGTSGWLEWLNGLSLNGRKNKKRLRSGWLNISRTCFLPTRLPHFSLSLFLSPILEIAVGVEEAAVVVEGTSIARAWVSRSGRGG